MTTLFTQHNESCPTRRRLNQKEHVERLLRSAIKEILVNENLLAKPTQDTTSDWYALMQYARTPVGQPITESIGARGELLAEGLVDGLVNALNWTKSKLAGGIEALKNMGGKIFDYSKKLFALIIESIPGGEEALDFLINFSGKMVEGLADMFNKAKESFAKWLSSMKGPILTFVFKEAQESGVLDEIKAEMQKKGSKKESFHRVAKGKRLISENENAAAGADVIQVISADPQKGVDLVANGARAGIGKLVTLIIKRTLQRSSTKILHILRKKIFFGSEFLKSKAGVFMVRIVNLLGMSIDASLENMVKMASRVWSSIKGFTGGGGGGVDIGNRADMEFFDSRSLPDLIGSLIGGESVIEKTLSAGFGDVKSLVDIISSAIKKITEKMVEKLSGSFDTLLEKVGLDPQGKIAQAIRKALGFAESVAHGAARVAAGV
jgi:hypothetical protein